MKSNDTATEKLSHELRNADVPMGRELVGEHLEGITGRELAMKLADPHWRLRNIYRILDRDGAELTYKPNAVQERFYKNLWWKNLVLKARQRGFSTATQIMMLDQCLFCPNTAAAVIAQDEPNATKIFRKVKFAYERLPPLLLERMPLGRDSATELILKNGSTLGVTTTARSTTLQLLHVSEFGPICAKRPDKASEIVSGSFPAAANGIIVVESTAEGREGAFYEMAVRAEALQQQKRELTRMDYNFHFASWWDEPAYGVDPRIVPISGAEHDYFNKIESLTGHKIDARHRAWYIATRDGLFAGDAAIMRSQFPSVPAEAFEESQEGVYYADQLAAARRTGRITDIPYDPRLPVNTFWDLGLNDDTVIWFHQRVDGWDNFIDYFECSDQSYAFYVQHLQSTGYVWGTHHLPHDANQRRPGAYEIKTTMDILHDLGLRNMVVVPRAANEMDAIRQCRDAFARYRFDQNKCKVGLHHLDHFRKAWNQRLGVWADHPLDNGHQHAADALRQHAQAYQGPVEKAPSRFRRRRVSGLAV